MVGVVRARMMTLRPSGQPLIESRRCPYRFGGSARKAREHQITPQYAVRMRRGSLPNNNLFERTVPCPLPGRVAI